MRRPADPAGVTLLRYEDMVTRFDLWLWDFLRGITRACRPDAAGAVVLHRRLQQVHARAVARHAGDFQVVQENPLAHKRQVAPGDHRRKLRPDTVASLDRLFADVLACLGYDR